MVRCQGSTFPFWKLELVPLHINSRAPKGNSFHSQAKSLFFSIFSPQLDRAPGAEDAMPGQSWNLPQNPHDLARRTGPSGSASHCSIG